MAPLSVLDESSGIYWNLPGNANTNTREITLVLPAATYSDGTSARGYSDEIESADRTNIDQSRSSATSSGFPPVGLHTITRKYPVYHFFASGDEGCE